MFYPFVLLRALCLLNLIYAHSDTPANDGGTADAPYAQRHMSSEHHIDTFDVKSFFMLHDFNGNGLLDRDEIEAIYGVHHPYSQKQSKDEQAHQEKADRILKAVLNIMDKNNDGKISLDEFIASGLDALPSFAELGAEGHHYDVESEFFLHHEERYHSTPETQTDNAYTHPEDLEHFSQHEKIERDEIVKEAAFQGISVEEAIEEHRRAEAAAEEAKRKAKRPQKIQRVTPPEKLDPEIKYRQAREEETDEWGTGKHPYQVPTSPEERLRRKVPYKYKFRRNWNDF